jgi:hypothetical protein
MIKKRKGRTVPKKRKGVVRKRPRREKVVVITEKPVDMVNTVVPPKTTAGKKVWSAVNDIRTAMFYGIGVAIGVAPLAAHIFSQFYCGAGANARCTPIEFPAWMELIFGLGALAFANAARDVVSKSFKQLFEAAKDAPAFLSSVVSGRRNTREFRAKAGNSEVEGA